jgi:hypothetical protein
MGTHDKRCRVEQARVLVPRRRVEQLGRDLWPNPPLIDDQLIRMYRPTDYQFQGVGHDGERLGRQRIREADRSGSLQHDRPGCQMS